MFCGLKIEIHHIKPKAEGGPDTLENAIPLCFNCHADMRTYDAKHPKGTKYSEAELIRFRDLWYEKIKNSGGVQSISTAETDKIIYNKILEILPWNGSISFINTNNFAGFSFRLDDLNQIYNFQHICENPAFEFLDADLEGCKTELLQSTISFGVLIGQYTFPTASSGRNHVPPEWEETNSPHFWRVVDEIHVAAKSVVSAYQNLTRMATRKLGIVPSQFY